jgi:superfamily II DNA or RNA helicase
MSIGDRAMEVLEQKFGLSFFDYQREAFSAHELMVWQKARSCLYYKTGAGKTVTGLGCLYYMGASKALIIAPPSTHSQWRERAEQMNLEVDCISHAKFRQPGYKLDREVPVIADEFHLFGGHGGKGWGKFRTLAGGLKAPIILMSATPNYNDAERVYCIQYILDPHSVKGGFLEFLYRECNTRANPHSMIPEVNDVAPFIHHGTAAEYLAALPNVFYLADDLVYQIEDIHLPPWRSAALEKYGYNIRKHRMVASKMEERHTRAVYNCIDKNGLPNSHMVIEILALKQAKQPMLIFANHETIARPLAQFLGQDTLEVGLVTGKTSAKKKQEIIDSFNAGDLEYLVGTASLATGTDGMDKVCDRLLIVDDTDDDSLRRQLIGRIMPRGATATAGHNKRVFRLEFS